MTGIYLRQDGKVTAMREAAYDKETVLQELVAEHPEMLAGDGSGGPASAWLLIRREAAVYDEEDAASRGVLDHLFIDGEGVPTLVEVKRSSDTRLRREVVGQMLDYAANAAHWTVEQVQAWLEARCAADDLDVDAVLGDHADDADELWNQVRANLAAGRLRLVFVADVIPPALARIIEFLNGQMADCEVLGIEVRQYLGGDAGQQIIVPRAIGQTEQARQVKGKRKSRRWDRTSVQDDLLEKCGQAHREVLDRVLAWADDRGLRYLYGHGAVDGSVQAGVDDGARRIFPFVIYTNGYVELPFMRMADHPPFSDPALREQYRDRLATLEGFDLAADATTRRPSVPMEVLIGAGRLEAFLGVVEWALAQSQQP
jgi:hypothetical protein